MPPTARNTNQGACTHANCVSIRARFQGMCAARAMYQAQVEALEARLGIQRIRTGGRGNLPANAVRVERSTDTRLNTENVHLLRSRFRSLHAEIHQTNRSEEMPGVLKAIEDKATDLELSLPTIPEELLGETVAVMNALRDKVNKLRVIQEPMSCGICLLPFEGSDAMTGKNCYHWCHAGCIARLAYTKVEPRHRDFNAPYHDYVDFTQEEVVLAGGGSYFDITHNYKLKPACLEEDGETAKGFPANVWLECSVCRDPHYANDAYMGLATQALSTLDQEDTQVMAPLSAPEQLEKWREDKFVLLIEPPDTTDIVMLVEARVPNVQQPEGFPTFGKASGVYRQCGFTFGKVGDHCDGGSAYYRARHPDDVVDNIATIPGTLRQTAPQKKDEWYVTEDTADLPEADRSWKKRKVLKGGGAWKFDYPQPTA